jgi:hypothetical protein
LTQFDLSGGGLNSQYLTTRLTMPVEAFVIDLGGCLETIQDSGDSGVAYAGELGFDWIFPVFAQSQLSLLGRFSSGTEENSTVRAFQPVTTMTQGNVLKARLSGLSMVLLDYTARFDRFVSAGFSASFFTESGGSFLGNEFFGKLYWSPTSDFWLNLGCGVFFPHRENTATLRLELNAILSIF